MQEYPLLGSERPSTFCPLSRSFSRFPAPVETTRRNILALTGRRDLVSDGVWDYCAQLSEALRPHGFETHLSELKWAHSGWLSALRQLWKQLSEKSYEWVLLQYTAMGWSGRGFPIGAIAAACVAKFRRAKLAVVFHEPTGYRARGAWARLRFVCQQSVVRVLYMLADTRIFTVPPSNVPWLHQDAPRIYFIPIGSNIPQNLKLRQLSAPSADSPRTVAVFCVTNLWRTKVEVDEIAAAIRHVRKSVPHLRLIVFGRGALEAQSLLEDALRNAEVKLSVLGVLPAGEVTRILSESHVLLYVRDTLVLQHGSILAAVACGLPTVAYGDEARSSPLSDAGIMLSPPGDQRAFHIALERILTEDTLWTCLHERSLRVHKKYFAWEVIARSFEAALTLPWAGAAPGVPKQEPRSSCSGTASYRIEPSTEKQEFKAGEASSVN